MMEVSFDLGDIHILAKKIRKLLPTRYPRDPGIRSFFLYIEYNSICFQESLVYRCALENLLLASLKYY